MKRKGSRRATSLAVRAFVGVLTGMLVCALFGACASSGTERHLSPIYSELSSAGGGKEIEALGGALRLRYLRTSGTLTQWALRPLVVHDALPGQDYRTRFLVPFGTEDKRGKEYVWQLLPLARYSHREFQSGQTIWTLLTLPGIYWSKTEDGRIVRAWFPFGGVTENFLSFDRIVFVLFPFFLKTERNGRTSYHFLFPIFAYAHGAGGPTWRVWPLYGNSRWKGRYDRWFVLWPIWTYEHNDLHLAPQKQEYKWLLFPVVGHTSRGSFQATTLLWPFFGWSRNPESGFRAFDAPWPLVRYLRDPENDVQRTRVWPFFSHYRGDGLESTWFLWPIFNFTHETYDKAEKYGRYVLPFWQSWKRYDQEAGYSSFEKLWPLYLLDRPEEHTTRFAFPTLNPLWRTADIDDMYAWMWELYTREVNHGQVRERSWLGIYRREKDEYEDRRSIVGLWGERRYREKGARIRETSLLFGLLRWRSRADGSLEWLAPALPGPGWPLERVHD